MVSWIVCCKVLQGFRVWFVDSSCIIKPQFHLDCVDLLKYKSREKLSARMFKSRTCQVPLPFGQPNTLATAGLYPLDATASRLTLRPCILRLTHLLRSVVILKRRMTQYATSWLFTQQQPRNDSKRSFLRLHPGTKSNNILKISGTKMKQPVYTSRVIFTNISWSLHAHQIFTEHTDPQQSQLGSPSCWEILGQAVTCYHCWAPRLLEL